MTEKRNLMQLWHRHKHECRPIGAIVADARAGRLPGLKADAKGFGFVVVDELAALDAMRNRL